MSIPAHILIEAPDQTPQNHTQVPVNELRGALGPNAWAIWVALLPLRDSAGTVHITIEGIAQFVAPEHDYEGVRLKNKLSVPQIKRALTKLSKADLIKSARKPWQIRLVKYTKIDAYIQVPCYIHTLAGACLSELATVPITTARWLKTANKRGGKRGGGRPSKPQKSTLFHRPLRCNPTDLGATGGLTPEEINERFNPDHKPTPVAAVLPHCEAIGDPPLYTVGKRAFEQAIPAPKPEDIYKRGEPKISIEEYLRRKMEETGQEVRIETRPPRPVKEYDQANDPYAPTPTNNHNTPQTSRYTFSSVLGVQDPKPNRADPPENQTGPPDLLREEELNKKKIRRESQRDGDPGPGRASSFFPSGSASASDVASSAKVTHHQTQKKSETRKRNGRRRIGRKRVILKDWKYDWAQHCDWWNPETGSYPKHAEQEVFELRTKCKAKYPQPTEPSALEVVPPPQSLSLQAAPISKIQITASKPIGMGLGSTQAKPTPRSTRTFSFLPELTRIADLLTPGAPYLDATDSDEHLAEMLAAWYRSAYEKHFGQKCWSFTRPKKITTSRWYALLVECAKELIAHKISPVEWCMWSFEIWERTNPNTENPMRAVWVLSPKRVRTRWDWFERENQDASYCVPTCTITNTERLYLEKRNLFMAAVNRSGGNPNDDQVKTLLEQHFPEGMHLRLLQQIAEDGRLRKAEINQKLAEGKWVWG